MATGLIFEPRVIASADGEAEHLPCFIGHLAPRPGVTPPPELATWLRRHGWWPATGPGDGLRGVPVPVESWEAFDVLFLWNGRDYGGGHRGATRMGAAVRTFFRQGGRRCLVVAVADPLPADAPRARRDEALEALVPSSWSGVRRQEWRGIQLLKAMEQAAFAALPDLSELVCDPAPPPAPAEAAPMAIEPRFSDCIEAGRVETAGEGLATLEPPRADDGAWQRWRRILSRAGAWIARHRRDLQLVAAPPLPHPDSLAARRGPLAALAAGDALDAAPSLGSGGIASAFLQLVYPWLRGPGGDLPGAVEGGEGALCALLGRAAAEGALHRTLRGQTLEGVTDLAPRLDRAAREGALVPGGRALIERVSLFGFTPGGVALLSDVTTSADSTFRPARSGRIFARVIRAARQVGEEAAFENSGEALWALLRWRMERLLEQMARQGAVAPDFRVRCDRSTMSQNDLDNGRVVAELLFRPVAAIDTLRIRLSLDGGAAEAEMERAA